MRLGDVSRRTPAVESRREPSPKTTGEESATSVREPASANRRRQRLRVSVETLRNREQGKRHPQGPARALLRIIDKAPEAAMAALDNA